MNYVRNFKDLEVYKISRELSRQIFTISREFPSEEKYALTDQVRRCSRSVGAQIAESWGKRKYEKHFTLKLSDADFEQYETQHWIEVAGDCNYIDDTQKFKLLSTCESIGKMLNSMIEKASLFCK